MCRRCVVFRPQLFFFLSFLDEHLPPQQPKRGSGARCLLGDFWVCEVKTTGKVYSILVSSACENAPTGQGTFLATKRMTHFDSHRKERHRRACWIPPECAEAKHRRLSYLISCLHDFARALCRCLALKIDCTRVTNAHERSQGVISSRRLLGGA